MQTRQCAWCLRLMDNFGEPISAPQAKRYEISHGMCRLCGSLWLEQVMKDTDKLDTEGMKRAELEMKEDI